jgi:transposase
VRSILVIGEAYGPQPRRKAHDPTPRFRPDRTRQLDVLLGSVEHQVPQDHLARSVWSVVDRLDTSALESQYSALGRHGFHPKRLLALWAYASLIGLHHSTKLARASRTDAAMRWLCGGDSPSGPTLRRVRMKQAAFFAAAIEQTVTLGSNCGLVDVDALAVDSVRLRAHAASSNVRTVERSTKRLSELRSVDLDTLDENQRSEHDGKVAKHEAGLATCTERNVASVVTTNPAAALMKFPSGASAPGHRATVIASGVSSRFVIGVLVDADPTDHGKLGPAVTHARDVLDRLGLRNGRRLTAAADAGYFSDRDLQFAVENKDWVDLLIHPMALRGEANHKGYFTRERFTIQLDGTVICPVGRTMLGPYNNNKDGTILKYEGPNCHNCELRPQCTPGRRRNLQIAPAKERARLAMHQRMTEPNATERYNQRIGTIEPVFSFLEDAMGFRRCSSRLPQTVQSEVLLKILAYNIDRIIRAELDAAKLLCVFVLIDEHGRYMLPESPLTETR